MGKIKFRVGIPDGTAAARLKHSYAVDAMLVSYAVGASIDAQVITIDMPCNDSCHYFFPWPTAGGDLMLCTTSLRLTDSPYELEIELARGTVGRLLSKLAFWRDPGIDFSETLSNLIGQCQAKLIEAVFQADAKSRVQAACAAIDLAIESTQLLVEEYVSQVNSRESPPAPVSFGVVCRAPEFNESLSDSDIKEKPSAEDTLQLKMDETRRLPPKADECDCATADLLDKIDKLFLPVPGLLIDSDVSQALVRIANDTRRVFRPFDFSASQSAENPCSAVAPAVGPILDWADNAIDQMFQTEKDFDAIRDSLFVLSKTIVENLPKPVSSFYVAAGVGARRDTKFDDHQRLQLTLDAMCGIYKSAPQLPLLVSFHQPIGGEIDNDPRAISPLHGADALLRADAGLQMIGLEISFATNDFPSTRDLLQINELVDVWSQFGLPLFAVITLPLIVEFHEQPIRRLPVQETDRNGNGAADERLPIATTVEQGNARRQKFAYQELRRVVSLLQSKSALHALYFSSANELIDSQPGTRPKKRLAFQEIISQVISDAKTAKI